MKTNLVWSIIIIAVLLIAILPSWASAQDGPRDTAPDQLAGYKDWLFGILDRGIRVTGGTDCQKTDNGQACQFDFTLRWAE